MYLKYSIRGSRRFVSLDECMAWRVCSEIRDPSPWWIDLCLVVQKRDLRIYGFVEAWNSRPLAWEQELETESQRYVRQYLKNFSCGCGTICRELPLANLSHRTFRNSRRHLFNLFSAVGFFEGLIFRCFLFGNIFIG